MELTSKEKGNLTELQCLVAFYKLGYKVSIPYGENCRYDMIVDTGKHLLRVQCKTSKFVSEECFSFACRSTRVNSQGCYEQRYTKDEIDYFCTYWDNQCYLIPVEECGKGDKCLRIAPTKNGQIKNVNVFYLTQKKIIGHRKHLFLTKELMEKNI